MILAALTINRAEDVEAAQKKEAPPFRAEPPVPLVPRSQDHLGALVNGVLTVPKESPAQWGRGGAESLK